MVELLKRIWFWVLIGPQPAAVKTPKPQKKKLTKAEKEAAAMKEAGRTNISEFYFKKDILDQLDGYFDVMKRMKKGHPDAYHLFSKIGGYIMPGEWLYVRAKKGEKLDPFLRETHPTAGCLFLAPSDKYITDKIEDGEPTRNSMPRCVYFRKFHLGKGPSDIQQIAPKGSDLYEVAVYFDWRRTGESVEEYTQAVGGRSWGENGVPMRCAVIVEPDGTVRTARMRPIKGRTIQSHKNHAGPGKKNGRPPDTITLPPTGWVIYSGYKDVWFGETPAESIENLFLCTMRMYEMAHMATAKVSVRKGKIQTCFGLHIERTPYFFKDRDVTVTKNGQRCKIFHVVRTHSRQLASGKTTTVRAHFRGENKFSWNGYSVKVTVPGFHHGLTQIDFDVACVDSEFLEEDVKTIGEKAVGKALAKLDDYGVGGMYPSGRRTGKQPKTWKKAKKIFSRAEAGERL